ncbi:MAG TPA: hypothetical protein VMP01_12025 [Pirellulaceae bacterium]|nr:hypothetical protein [Pirellulaceae bacterium]
MATNRRRWLPLVCLTAASLVLPGCKPEIPTAGGLVATDRPVESAAADGVAADPGEVAAASLSWEPVPAIVPAPASDQTPPPPSIPIVANPGLIPVDEASSRGSQGDASQPAGSQSPPAAVRGTASIRLSAGVAVPQSLPMGTVMGMSVDYAIDGPLNNSSRYVWVVSSQAGENVEVAMQPKVTGTLQLFFLKLRPENGPFNCHIDEISPGGRRTRVSNVATMQTNY